jgi:hypothetical protein
MGVRVEDSVCVTDDGPLNLSVEAVKEVRFMACGREGELTALQIADIEALGRA